MGARTRRARVKALDAVAGELGAGTDVVAVAGDVADPAHRAALADAVRRLGGLDLLVNNACCCRPWLLGGRSAGR
jgi:NAD(P)-dependent dehydrogenase (short-subunit alcohol dehydrogenase family)